MLGLRAIVAVLIALVAGVTALGYIFVHILTNLGTAVYPNPASAITILVVIGVSVLGIAFTAIFILGPMLLSRLGIRADIRRMRAGN